MNCLAWVLWNSSAFNHGAVSPARFPQFYESSMNTSLNGLIQYMAFVTGLLHSTMLLGLIRVLTECLLNISSYECTFCLQSSLGGCLCVFHSSDVNTVTENTHVQLFLDTCFHFSTSGDAESQDCPVHSFLKNF